MKPKFFIKELVSCFRSSNRSSRIQSDSFSSPPRPKDEESAFYDADSSAHQVVKTRRGKKKQQLAVNSSNMWRPSLSVISEDRAVPVAASVVSEPTKITVRSKKVAGKSRSRARIEDNGGGAGGGRHRLDYDDRCTSLSTIPPISPMAFLF